MKKTIADVAKLSGVAKSTVSRYLNGGSVSEATKRKMNALLKKQDIRRILLPKV
jgi:LacI family transcriptional regulator, sucrose operon repressor